MPALDPTWIGIIGFFIFVFMMVIGVPIGIGMGVVGFAGIWAIRGWPVALNALYQLPYSAISNWLLSVIPMFIFMGYIAFHAGFARDAYETAYKWVGKLPGGLAVATLIGGALFGACSGSSVAATAAIGKLCLPEMERHGYDRKLAAGTAAMSGPLDALIPPSILLVLYGVITEENVAKLLIAGILPGILSMLAFIVLVIVRVKLNPSPGPSRRELFLEGKTGQFKRDGRHWNYFFRHYRRALRRGLHSDRGRSGRGLRQSDSVPDHEKSQLEGL